MPKPNFKLTVTTLSLAAILLVLVGGWFVAFKEPLARVYAFTTPNITSPDNYSTFEPGTNNVTVRWDGIADANFNLCVAEGGVWPFTFNSCGLKTSGMSMYTSVTSPKSITMNNENNYDFFIQACNKYDSTDCAQAGRSFFVEIGGDEPPSPGGIWCNCGSLASSCEGDPVPSTGGGICRMYCDQCEGNSGSCPWCESGDCEIPYFPDIFNSELLCINNYATCGMRWRCSAGASKYSVCHNKHACFYNNYICYEDDGCELNYDGNIDEHRCYHESGLDVTCGIETGSAGGGSFTEAQKYALKRPTKPYGLSPGADWIAPGDPNLNEVTWDSATGWWLEWKHKPEIDGGVTYTQFGFGCYGDAYTVYMCNAVGGSECEPCNESNPENCPGEYFLGKRYKQSSNDYFDEGSETWYYGFDNSDPDSGKIYGRDESGYGDALTNPSRFGTPGRKCWRVFASSEGAYIPDAGHTGVTKSDVACFIYGFLPVKFTVMFEEEFEGTGYVTSHTPSNLSDFLHGYPSNGYNINAIFHDHRNSAYDTLQDTCGVVTTRYDEVLKDWRPACVSDYPAGITIRFKAHAAPGSRFMRLKIGDLWEDIPNYIYDYGEDAEATKELIGKEDGFTEYYVQAAFCSESFEGKPCVLPTGKECGDGEQTNECWGTPVGTPADKRACCHSVCTPNPPTNLSPGDETEESYTLWMDKDGKSIAGNPIQLDWDDGDWKASSACNETKIYRFEVQKYWLPSDDPPVEQPVEEPVEESRVTEFLVGRILHNVNRLLSKIPTLTAAADDPVEEPIEEPIEEGPECPVPTEEGGWFTESWDGLDGSNPYSEITKTAPTPPVDLYYGGVCNRVILTHDSLYRWWAYQCNKTSSYTCSTQSSIDYFRAKIPNLTAQAATEEEGYGEICKGSITTCEPADYSTAGFQEFYNVGDIASSISAKPGLHSKVIDWEATSAWPAAQQVITNCLSCDKDELCECGGIDMSPPSSWGGDPSEDLLVKAIFFCRSQLPIPVPNRWVEHNDFPTCISSPCKIESGGQVEPTKNPFLAWDILPEFKFGFTCGVPVTPRYQIELFRTDGSNPIATSLLLLPDIDRYALTDFVAPNGTPFDGSWWEDKRGLTFKWRIITSNGLDTADSDFFYFLVNEIPTIHDNRAPGENIGYHHWANTTDLKMGAEGRDSYNLDSVVFQAWSADGTSWDNWDEWTSQIFLPTNTAEKSIFPVVTTGTEFHDGIFRQTSHSTDELGMVSTDRPLTDLFRLLEKDPPGTNPSEDIAYYWVDTLEPVSYVESIDGIDRGELATYTALRIISGDGTPWVYAAIDRWNPYQSSLCATSVGLIDLSNDPCLGDDQQGNFGNLHASGLYQISASIPDPFNFSDTFYPNGGGSADDHQFIYDGTSVGSKLTTLNTKDKVTPGAVQSVDITVSAIDKATSDNSDGAFSETITVQIRNDYPRVILDSPLNDETLSNVDIEDAEWPLMVDVEFNTFKTPDSPSAPYREVEIWVAREKGGEITEQYDDFTPLCTYRLVDEAGGEADGVAEIGTGSDNVYSIDLNAKDPAPDTIHSNGWTDYAGTVTCNVTAGGDTPEDIRLLEGYKYKWYTNIVNESYTCYSDSTGSVSSGYSDGNDGICQDESHITTRTFEVLKSVSGYIWDATFLTCSSDYTPNLAKSNEILSAGLKSGETFDEIVATHITPTGIPPEIAENEWEPGDLYPSYRINNIRRGTIRICTSMPFKKDPAGTHTLRFMPACKNDLSQYLTPCFEVNTDTTPPTLIGGGGHGINYTAGPVYLDLGYQTVSSKWFTSISGNVYAGGSIRFRVPTDAYAGGDSDIKPYAINENGVISSSGTLDVSAYTGIDPVEGEMYPRRLTDQPDNRYYVENIGGEPGKIWPPSYNFTPPTNAEEITDMDFFKDNETLDPAKVYKIDIDLLNTITDTNSNELADVSFTYNLKGDGGGVVVIYVTDPDPLNPTPLIFSANFRAPDVSSDERILFVSGPKIVIAREFNRKYDGATETWTDTTADNYDAAYAISPGINRDTRANIEAGLLSDGGIEFESMNPDSSNLADNTVIIEGLIATTEGIGFKRDRWETNKLPGHIIKYNLLYLDKLTQQGRENPTSNYNGLYLHNIVWKQQD